MAVVDSIWDGTKWLVFSGVGDDIVVDPGLTADDEREQKYTDDWWDPFASSRNPLADNGGDPMKMPYLDPSTKKGINCGLMPSTEAKNRSNLITVNGTTTYSASGTASNPIIIRGRKFTGQVKVQGSYYTFKDCWFAWTGANLTGGDYGAMLSCITYGVRGIVIEDCLFDAGVNATFHSLSPFQGHHFTMRRCVMRNTEDGPRPFANAESGTSVYEINYDSLFVGNYIGELAYYSPNDTRADSDNASHSDCSQPYGGHNVEYRGNVMRSIYSSEVGQAQDPPVYDETTGYLLSGNRYYPNQQGTSIWMFQPTPTQTPSGYYEMDFNYLEGGAYMLNMPNATVNGPIHPHHNLIAYQSTRKTSSIPNGDAYWRVHPDAHSWLNIHDNKTTTGADANVLGNS